MDAFTNRIELSGKGTGEFSEEAIEKRAREIAHADGRHATQPQDLQRAREEIAKKSPSTDAPEENASTAELKEWDTPPSSLGVKHPKAEPEDENVATDELVKEGLEEADHDTRARSGE